MNTSSILPNPIPKAQAWSFLLMEAALLLTFLAFTLHLLPPALDPVMRGVHIGTAMVLMVASPFFLRSLRVIALLGWTLGVVCFLLR